MTRPALVMMTTAASAAEIPILYGHDLFIRNSTKPFTGAVLTESLLSA